MRRPNYKDVLIKLRSFLRNNEGIYNVFEFEYSFISCHILVCVDIIRNITVLVTKSYCDCVNRPTEPQSCGAFLSFDVQPICIPFNCTTLETFYSWVEISKKTNEWINGWIDEWMNGWMDEWMDDWLIDRMNYWIDEWADEWINELNRWMDDWMTELIKELLNERTWYCVLCDPYMPKIMFHKYVLTTFEQLWLSL